MQPYTLSTITEAKSIFITVQGANPASDFSLLPRGVVLNAVKNLHISLGAPDNDGASLPLASFRKKAPENSRAPCKLKHRQF